MYVYIYVIFLLDCMCAYVKYTGFCCCCCYCVFYLNDFNQSWITHKILVKVKKIEWNSVLFFFFFLPDYSILSVGNVASFLFPHRVCVRKRRNYLLTDTEAEIDLQMETDKFRDPHCCEATIKRPLMTRHCCLQDPWAEQTWLQRMLSGLN